MMDGVAGAGTGPAWVIDVLRRRLAPADAADGDGGRQRGDYDLNPDWTPGGGTRRLRDAAVLVPLVLRGAATGLVGGAGGAGVVDGTVFGSGLTLILTRRSERLEVHAGQISFPGGRVEAGDAGAAATALRETEEEIGLARTHVEVIGFLPDHLVISGYRVTPVVALVRPGFDIALDRSEVAEVFEVPLSFVLDERNHVRRIREFEGESIEFTDFPFGRHNIWGATAGMLLTLHRTLRGELPPGALR